MNKLPILIITGAIGLLCGGCEKHEAPVPDASPPAKEEKPAPAPSSTSGSPPAAPEPAKETGVVRLFNGKDLTGWKSVNFGGEGEIEVVNGEIRLGMGESMTAIVYDGKDELPTTNYEISLEANKLMGNDFLCGLTFPVRDNHATLIVGGWGGAVVGISCLDGFDASENETAQFMAFDTDRWYRIRLRVTDDRLTAWIDDRQMIDSSIQDREVSMRPGEIELCIPLGIASYQTRSALRNIRLKKL